MDLTYGKITDKEKKRTRLAYKRGRHFKKKYKE